MEQPNYLGEAIIGASMYVGGAWAIHKTGRDSLLPWLLGAAGGVFLGVLLSELLTGAGGIGSSARPARRAGS